MESFIIIRLEKAVLTTNVKIRTLPGLLCNCQRNSFEPIKLGHSIHKQL